MKLNNDNYLNHQFNPKQPHQQQQQQQVDLIQTRNPIHVNQQRPIWDQNDKVYHQISVIQEPSDYEKNFNPVTFYKKTNKQTKSGDVRCI